jgi:hypothetical protein
MRLRQGSYAASRTGRALPDAGSVTVNVDPRPVGRDRRETDDDDKGNRAVVSFAEPISSGYVLVKRDHLANVTILEHERWKRAHPEFCRKLGIG